MEDCVILELVTYPNVPITIYALMDFFFWFDTKKKLGYIVVAPIMQLRTCVIKIVNIQGRSPYVVKVIFHVIRNCS